MSKSKNKHPKEDDKHPKSCFNQEFFHSLEGKDVKIYRGGPEARHGVVVDVQSDYVALAAKDSVIYYQAKHIKSVSQPTKPKPPHHEEKQKEKGKVRFLSAKNFHKLLKKMEQQVIQLNQGGPESIHGMLLSVKHDFLMMFIEDDGLIYVNINHVKSVSSSRKPFKGNKGKMKEKKMDAHHFDEVFRGLENKWVSINRGGPEAVEGVLVVEDGDYKLYRNEEVIHVNPCHVRSISSEHKKKDKDKDKHGHKDGKKAGHDGKDKDKDCDCKDCKKCCRKSGMDRFRDGKEDKDKDKDKDKDDSKFCKQSKDWFNKKSDRRNSGFTNLGDDDNHKNDNDKDDNKDENKDSKYDSKNK